MMEECKKMCKSMSMEEKANCVSKMMPNCLDSVLDFLNEKESVVFARDMQEKLNGVLEKYLKS
jgi:hypothetical protein